MLHSWISCFVEIAASGTTFLELPFDLLINKQNRKNRHCTKLGCLRHWEYDLLSIHHRCQEMLDEFRLRFPNSKISSPCRIVFNVGYDDTNSIVSEQFFAK